MSKECRLQVVHECTRCKNYRSVSPQACPSWPVSTSNAYNQLVYCNSVASRVRYTRWFDDSCLTKPILRLPKRNRRIHGRSPSIRPWRVTIKISGETHVDTKRQKPGIRLAATHHRKYEARENITFILSSTTTNCYFRPRSPHHKPNHTYFTTEFHSAILASWLMFPSVQRIEPSLLSRIQDKPPEMCTER